MSRHSRSNRWFGSGGGGWCRLTIVALVAVALAVAGPVGAQVIPSDQPTIAVQPTSGPPGTNLEIVGSAFFGDFFADVSLQVAGTDAVHLGRVEVRSDGSFSSDEFAIPEATPPGRHLVTAQGCMLIFNGGSECVPTNNFASAAFEVTSGAAERYTPTKPVYDPESGLPGDQVSQTEAHLKFLQESAIRLTDDTALPFVFDDAHEPTADAQDQLDAVNALLSMTPGAEVSRMFDNRTVAEYDRERARQEQASAREIGDKNLYYVLTYPAVTDAATLLNALNAFSIVEIAYADPLPGEEPTNHSSDYVELQGYRVGAPGGINADAAYHVAGGRGENTQVIDIERFFNPDHEELPAVSVWDNGDVDAQWPGDAFDHGTAVMGQLFGRDNQFGVQGLVDLAAPGFVSTAGGRPQAIDIAHNNSQAGDVILLELQRVGPNGGCTMNNQTGCAPEEWVQASYDAVVAAVADGIIIVAAAGNGRQDLDGAEYQDWLDRGDSGAIIVGAGAADLDAGVADLATPCNDDDPAPARSQLGFSNFGSRVDLHGWGQCVTTTGYGWLNYPGATGNGADDAYTGTFGGTSSASPIVAGAAAIVSSVTQQQGLPAPTSTQVRSILVATGTPQVLPADNPAARAGNIGPLPNVAAALGLSADLAVATSATHDPVIAGTTVTYTASVTNDGPNVAVHTELVNALPAQATYVSDNQVDCTHSAGVVTCGVGTLPVGATFTVDILTAVPANLVHTNGGPLTITNTATAASSLADPDTANNTATTDSLVVAVADLEVVDVEVLHGVPGEQLIGVDIPITVGSVVRNNGPSSPMDAVLELNASPSTGASVDPDVDEIGVAALSSVARTAERTFTVRCEAPGEQQVVIDVGIRPASALDTDPDNSNNTGQVTITVDCIMPIAINVRPGNQFNWVNVGSRAAIPVAALTTEAGEYGLPLAFDATTIVPASVRFGSWDELTVSGAGPLSGLFHALDSFELDDRTRDGDIDMWFHFVTSATGISGGDTEACMRGQFVSGGNTFTFFGCDAVTAMP